MNLPAVAGVRVGVFPEEVSKTYTAQEGVPSNDVRSIAVTASGEVYAGTAQGLARLSAGKWVTVAADGEAVDRSPLGVTMSGSFPRESWFIGTARRSLCRR